MLVLSGKFTVKPEHREKLMQMAAALVAPSNAEEGCISYQFYQDGSNPNNFLFFEEWKNQAALDSHFQKPYFLEFAEKLPEMIIGKANITTYEVSKVNTVS